MNVATDGCRSGAGNIAQRVEQLFDETLTRCRSGYCAVGNVMAPVPEDVARGNRDSAGSTA